MAVLMYHVLSEKLLDIILTFVRGHPECTIFDIQDHIYELMLSNSDKIPKEAYESISWKKSRPYSYMIESIVTSYVLRGLLEETKKTGGFVLSDYGEKFLKSRLS